MDMTKQVAKNVRATLEQEFGPQPTRIIDGVSMRVAANLLAPYRIEPKGKPIQPGDVLIGDRIRIEYQSGKVSEYTVEFGFEDYFVGTIFLLDRPDCDADFEFPISAGSIISMRMKGGNPDYIIVAVNTGFGDWRISGMRSALSFKDIRDDYYNFEIVKDGDES